MSDIHLRGAEQPGIQGPGLRTRLAGFQSHDLLVPEIPHLGNGEANTHELINVQLSEDYFRWRPL